LAAASLFFIFKASEVTQGDVRAQLGLETSLVQRSDGNWVICKEDFPAKERSALSLKAVNRLIAAVEAKRLLDNKELAEVIRVCIQNAPESQLETLKLSDQQELERPDLDK